MIPSFLGALEGKNVEGTARYGLGLCFIVAVALIWALSSVLVQYMYTNYAFDSPFLITYIGVSLFTWPLPMKHITNKLISPCFQASVDTCHAVTELEDTCSSYCQMGEDYDYRTTPHPIPTSPSVAALNAATAAENQDALNSSIEEIPADAFTVFENRSSSTSETPRGPHQQQQQHHDHQPLDPDAADGIFVRGADIQATQWTRAMHVQKALQIAPVWFLANWSYNGALFFTSVASSTVLMSTCSLFAFLFAVCIRSEGFHWVKLGGVLLGIVGTALTAYHDYQDKTCAEHCRYALLGDALAVTAALAFGAYAVQIRLLCPRNEESYSMQSLLGYIGLVNMVVLSPVAVWILYGQTQMTGVIFGLILVRGLVDYVLSEYLYFRAVVLTNATVATLGLALTIPFAFAADFLIGNPHILSVSSALGAAAVVGGFLLVNVGNSDDSFDKDLKDSLHEQARKRQEQAEAFLQCHAFSCGCFVDNWCYTELCFTELDEVLGDDDGIAQQRIPKNAAPEYV